MNVTVKKLTNVSDGDTVELPSDIGRIDVSRWGPLHRQGADGNLSFGVVGTGDMEEYIIITEKGEGEYELPSGAQVVGFDNARDILVYAVPLSTYGGGA